MTAERQPAILSPLSIICRSEAMSSACEEMLSCATTRYPVLITGETGAGKGVLAKALHHASGRRGPFVSVNVAGLDDHLFSDTLFGHLRGAFSGADRDRPGMVKTAEGGSLFLDEIGDLTLQSQVKLLRLLEESEYLPLGSDSVQAVNSRFIFATNVDLEERIQARQFRRDLYFRISCHQLQIPPLRARREDMIELIEHFISEIAAELGKARPTIYPESLWSLMKYDFPGNVRELRGLLLSAMCRHREDLEWLHVCPRPRDSRVREAAPARTSGVVQARPVGQPGGETEVLFPERLPTLKGCVQLLVEEALNRANGCQTRAARMLGISQQAVSQRLKKA